MNSRILFIEDDIGIIESIRFAFSFYWPDAELIPAYLGQAGLEIASNEHIDVIVLDLGLPDMDGLDLLKELKQVSVAPVIVLSGRIEGNLASTVKVLGAHECLFKPFKQRELISCIKAHISSGKKI